jgi:predicted RNase H-like HicB family nuclease
LREKRSQPRVVKIEVQRDDEAGVWWASSTTDRGIITEAETIEALRERLKLLVPDMLEIDEPVQIDIEVRFSDVVQAT